MKAHRFFWPLYLVLLIGAALAGTMLLDPPVPGLAVNAERPAASGQAQALPGDHLHGWSRRGPE